MKPYATAAALLALLSPLPSQASAPLATIGGYTYTLVDLDLDDGITPAFTIESVAAFAGAAYLAPGSFIPDPYDARFTFGTASLTLPQGYATAWLPSGTEASATAALSSGSGSFIAQSQWQLAFTLSANTRLIATATGSASASIGPDSIAAAFSQLYLYYVSDTVTLEENEVLDTAFAIDGQDSRTLTVVLESGGSKMTGRTGFLTVAAVTSVPEPATYAMLGAGLLGLGALRRRQRR